MWLDGGYLGDTEGYFVPHTFEVTEQLRDRLEHVLAVELRAPERQDRQAQPHRRLPALGPPRPRMEPRRDLAAGAAQRDGAGADLAPAGPVP